MPVADPQRSVSRLLRSAAARARGFARYHRLSDPPVVIGGCERSGTTLLLSILSAHPELHAIPEESWAFASASLEWGDPDRPIHMQSLYRHLGEGRSPQSARRWCEKTPANVLFFGEILDHFRRRVRLIHIVRDGRDVISSRHPERPDDVWMQPDRWVKTVSAGASWQDDPDVLTIRYEDLVRDIDATVGAVCRHVGVEYVPQMRDWLDHARVRSSVHIRGGAISEVFANSIGKFRRPDFPFAGHVERLMGDPAARELLAHFGYL